MLRSLFATLVLATAAFAFGTPTASAQYFTVTNPWPTTAVQVRVGTVAAWHEGSAQMVVMKNVVTGQCKYWNLGFTEYGGFAASAHVVGGSNADNMGVVGGSETFCNVKLTPPVLNGFYLNLYGGEGADTIYSSSNGAGSVWLYGEGGADKILTGYSYFAAGWGGTGNDNISGRDTNRSEILMGEAGDDMLCEVNLSPYMAYMDGGPGTDKGCGFAETKLNIEVNTCNGCWIVN